MSVFLPLLFPPAYQSYRGPIFTSREALFFLFLCFDCEVFKYKTTCFLSVSKGKRVAWARSGGCVLFLGVNRSTFFSL